MEKSISSYLLRQSHPLRFEIELKDQVKFVGLHTADLEEVTCLNFASRSCFVWRPWNNDA